jgi:hypothetical protein
MITWRDDDSTDEGKFTIVDSDGTFSHPAEYVSKAIQQTSATFANGNVLIAYKGYNESS